MSRLHSTSGLGEEDRFTVQVSAKPAGSIGNTQAAHQSHQHCLGATSRPSPQSGPVISPTLTPFSVRRIQFVYKESLQFIKGGSMKKNMGTIDRTIRILAVLVIAGLLFSGQIEGVVVTVLGALAVVFLGTSLVSVCPLYVPLNISTRKEVSPQAK